jgi:hypothetical protein
VSHVDIPVCFLYISAILAKVLFIAKKNVTMSATVDVFCKAEAILILHAKKLVIVLDCIFMTPHDALFKRDHEGLETIIGITITLKNVS